MIPDEMMQKIFDKKIPVDVQFELTWRCNQTCIHCYQFSGIKDELSTGEVKDIISQLAEAGTLYLSFTGGEPLLRKDFWEIANFAFQKHFALVLQTNGILINAPNAKKIAELNFFAVHISILGATAKTHDKITQLPGSFEKVLKAVELLRQQKVKVILNLTLMKDNFKEYSKIKKLKDELDIPIRVSPYIFCKNDGSSFLEELRLDDFELKQFFLELKKDAKGGPLNNRGLLCNFSWCVCTINAKGEVYPCVAVPLVSGDLKKDSFSNIWKKSVVLEKIRSESTVVPKQCQDCNLSDWCFRCSGFSYLENGGLFSCSREARRFAKIIKEVNEYEEAKV